MKALDKARNLAQKIAKQAPDMRVPTAGGDFKPPAEGLARLRFVGYVEVGPQVETYLGSPRIKPKVLLQFELSGKKHPPIELEDGTVVPRRMTIELTHSNSERATLYKLFTVMNHRKDASHIAMLIGDSFIGKVFHHEFKDSRGQDRVVARLKPKGGEYTIAPPFYETEDGDIKEYAVDEMLSDPMLFFWDLPDMEQWDSLYIDGEFSDGNSRNVIQEKIRRSTEWENSPMFAILEEDDDIDPASYAALDPVVTLPEEDDSDSKAKPAKSAKPAKKTVKKAVVEEDEEDEDEDDDEEEAPPPPKKKAAKKTSKPAPKPPVDEDEDEEDEDEEDDEEEDDAPPSTNKQRVNRLLDGIQNL